MASLTDALVTQFLNGRYVASLATENPDGSIHMVAVWYWFDGGQVFVATSSRSRKARNLQSNTKISLMIDSRDPAASCGINIAGIAQILTGDSSRKRNLDIHRKYLSDAALADPRVGPVFAAWDDVTILQDALRTLKLLEEVAAKEKKCEVGDSQPPAGQNLHSSVANAELSACGRLPLPRR